MKTEGSHFEKLDGNTDPLFKILQGKDIICNRLLDAQVEKVLPV